MSELISIYWPAILAAALIGLAASWWLLRPRQRVRLTDATPLRPHMAAAEPAEAAQPPAAPTREAEMFEQPPPPPGEADDLQRLKGVGPRLAALLHSRDLHRFAQIAALSPAEIDALDRQLGPFSGRLKRDRLAEQAGLLASGDVAGFEQRFGRL